MKLKDITKKEIIKLFEFAKESATRGNITLAVRYGKMCKMIIKLTRVKIKLPICKCGAPLVAGITVRYRFRDGRNKRIVRTCLVCGRLTRFIIKNTSFSFL